MMEPVSSLIFSQMSVDSDELATYKWAMIKSELDCPLYSTPRRTDFEQKYKYLSFVCALLFDV